MRNRVSVDKLIEKFKSQYIDTGILNVPIEVVKIIITSYNNTKAEELKKGSIIIEPFGESKVTVRKTNSIANNGLSAKVVTVLDKSLNSEICNKANSDLNYLNSLKCDAN